MMTLKYTKKTGIEVIRYLPERGDFELSEKLFLKFIRGERW